ncbi:hypothetical protein BGW80DRAFT_1460502 [Lactifluus volemus]|nr:hypothetical protein BGW80DRAFT_1460502 [Lactifluus volemus]
MEGVPERFGIPTAFLHCFHDQNYAAMFERLLFRGHSCLLRITPPKSRSVVAWLSGHDLPTIQNLISLAACFVLVVTLIRPAASRAYLFHCNRAIIECAAMGSAASRASISLPGPSRPVTPILLSQLRHGSVFNDTSSLDASSANLTLSRPGHSKKYPDLLPRVD